MNKGILAFMVIGVLILLVGCEVQRDLTVNTNGAMPRASGNDENPSSPSPVAEVYQVVLEQALVMPADIEVNIGDTVEWVNKDDRTYTLTFDSGMLDERLPPGGRVTYTFPEKGQFSYQTRVSMDDSEEEEERLIRGTVLVR